MGWWDEGIMGGDSPLDFKGNFEDKFGSLDPEFNEWRVEDGKEPIPFILPEPDAVFALINEISGQWGDEHVFAQVAGFLVMERGAKMNDELRKAVLNGIDMELTEIQEEESGWSSPETRKERLTEFREAVSRYPDAGSTVEMPHSPGLFEKMADHLNKSG